MQPRGNSARGFGQKVKEEKKLKNTFLVPSELPAKMCWFSAESDFNNLCGLATASLSQPQILTTDVLKAVQFLRRLVLKEYLFTLLSNVQVLQRMCVNHTVKGRGGKERGRRGRDDTLSWMSLFARWNAHKKVSKHYVALRMVNTINVLLPQCTVSWLSKFKALECLSSQRDNHNFPPRLQHPLEHRCWRCWWCWAARQRQNSHLPCGNRCMESWIWWLTSLRGWKTASSHQTEWLGFTHSDGGLCLRALHWHHGWRTSDLLTHNHL